MEIKVKNCMEAFVFEALENALKSYPDICKCDKCIADMATWSLNNLPPKYVRSDLGDTYVRLEMYQKQHYTQVINIVAQAIEVVSKNPHH